MLIIMALSLSLLSWVLVIFMKLLLVIHHLPPCCLLMWTPIKHSDGLCCSCQQFLLSKCNMEPHTEQAQLICILRAI